jgi:IclR family transcriptional regulator, KDG regulon repressor
MTRDYTLSSVKNSLRLLQSFTTEEPERKVTELAQTLGMGHSTVSRMLATMASEGFVTKDPETQKYRLSLSILSLNSVIISNLEVTRTSQFTLQKLVDEIGESSHLGVMEGKDVVYINKVECNHPVQILSYIGRRNPLHSTSSGKVILAFQEEEVINRYIESSFEKFTVNTIIHPDGFRRTLHEIKEQEFAVSIEELRDGVASVSAPIRDHTGKVVYAVTVVGPVHRMDPQDARIIAKLKTAAKELSSLLGYRKG